MLSWQKKPFEHFNSRTNFLLSYTVTIKHGKYGQKIQNLRVTASVVHIFQINKYVMKRIFVKAAILGSKIRCALLEKNLIVAAYVTINLYSNKNVFYKTYLRLTAAALNPIWIISSAINSLATNMDSKITIIKVMKVKQRWMIETYNYETQSGFFLLIKHGWHFINRKTKVSSGFEVPNKKRQELFLWYYWAEKFIRKK